jgi:epoxyqueuosine reductase
LAAVYGQSTGRVRLIVISGDDHRISLASKGPPRSLYLEGYNTLNSITENLRHALLTRGADLVGVGSLTELPAETRSDLPTGVCVAVRFPKEVIRGITAGPTRAYYDQYNALNEKLDELVTFGAETLQALGYQAIAQTRAYVNQFATDFTSLLPHKTVATRAGLGWIGKSALLVTEQFGAMIRLSSILTDAPLMTDQPINQSRCGECRACTDACPASAISGELWTAGIKRDALFDAAACRQTARALARQGFGVEVTLCGKCIEVCPYTSRYLNEA